MDRKMSDPAKIRKQIETLKAKIARTEGEETALVEQSQQFKSDLRDALDCEAGEEKAAMAELRETLATQTEEIEALLDQVKEIA